MLVSIGIVRSTSASGICFVGDTPAIIGVLTLQSSRSSDMLSVLISSVNTMISSSPSCNFKKSFQVEWEVKRIGCFCVFITLCAKNMAWICVQCSVPLLDILHTLQKQFLVGYHHGDTFTGFHYWFSLRQKTKNQPLKWPSSDQGLASLSWHDDKAN